MFKFKISEQSLARLEAQVKADIKDVLAAPAVLNEVGLFVSDRLKYQARIAKPFNEAKSFPNLKASTVRNRAYLLKYNDPHPTAKVDRANMTLTGALLESLKWVIRGAGLIEIEFQGDHPRYRGKSGLIGKLETNQNIAEWLGLKGFKGFDMSVDENQAIKSRVNTIVKRFLRRGLKVREGLRSGG